jgi:hypothetical protein
MAQRHLAPQVSVCPPARLRRPHVFFFRRRSTGAVDGRQSRRYAPGTERSLDAPVSLAGEDLKINADKTKAQQRAYIACHDVTPYANSPLIPSCYARRPYHSLDSAFTVISDA